VIIHVFLRHVSLNWSFQALILEIKTILKSLITSNHVWYKWCFGSGLNIFEFIVCENHLVNCVHWVCWILVKVGVEWRFTWPAVSQLEGFFTEEVLSIFDNNRDILVYNDVTSRTETALFEESFIEVYPVWRVFKCLDKDFLTFLHLHSRNQVNSNRLNEKRYVEAPCVFSKPIDNLKFNTRCEFLQRECELVKKEPLEIELWDPNCRLCAIHLKNLLVISWCTWWSCILLVVITISHTHLPILSNCNAKVIIWILKPAPFSSHGLYSGLMYFDMTLLDPILDHITFSCLPDLNNLYQGNKQQTKIHF